MDIGGFLNAIAHVSSSWSIAAYSTAAVLAVLNVIASRRRRAPTNSLIWGIVVVICILGLAPTLANAYLERLKILGAVYRVRTLVVDAQHVPVSGATLRTTASNETTLTNQGIRAYSSGLDWVDSEDAFRWNPSYYEFEKTIIYSEQRDTGGIQYKDISVTLHPVVGGNVRTKSISRSDFLKAHRHLPL
jgi:hypothetical protein